MQYGTETKASTREAYNSSRWQPIYP